MRASHAGGELIPMARQRAARRFLRWQRWLWLRFLIASTFRQVPGPWHRFLRDGQVQVNRLRVLSGLRRHNDLRTAMTSRLAAEIIRA